jgi:ribonuclease BN (tRNA processing enzyme)
VIKLHVVQAEFGDCFILEYRSGNQSTTMLIDGGPSQTFKNHLKPTLQKLPLSGKIDLMVLSHIDNDHIIGLIDLLVEIKNQREKGIKELVNITRMWHNSFKDLLQLKEEPKEIISTIFQTQSLIKEKNITESIIMKGFQQGIDLMKLAKSLNIPINPDFDKVVVANDTIRSIRLNNINLHILGPTKRNLDKLRKEWNDWFSEKQKIGKTELGLVEILDKSVPNLASIMFLAEIKNRKILFTGDGLGQDVVEMLSKNEMLDKNGKFHVDVLKVPHHGSDRNTSLEFFSTLDAKYYILSANGRDDNPSLNTLRWIVETGKTSRKPKKIIFTNTTTNVKKILQKYDEKKLNYECIFLEKEENFLTISL